MTPWQEQNLAAISRRIAPLLRLPLGIVFERKTLYNHILVRRLADQLLLCYRHERRYLEEVQSRLCVSEPLALLSEYTQAMLLSLAWNPAPRRIFLLGLGGGRLQMILHHYLEEATLATIEVDPEVVAVAQRFFGFAPDERQRITVQDGRAYLRDQPDATYYDLILLDAYQASGVPRHLSTWEFYGECRAHLAPGGVIATNLHASTSTYDAARKTFALAFAHTATFQLLNGNVVVIGTDSEMLSPQELQARVRLLHERYGWQYPLPKLAQTLVSAAPYRERVQVLRD